MAFALSNETKEKIITEVKTLMDNREVVNQAYFSGKYQISRASFYNILKDNNIDDIGSYNRMVRSKPKFNFKISPEFVNVGNTKSNIEISKRESFWDGDKKLNEINIDKKEENNISNSDTDSNTCTIDITNSETIYKFETIKPFIIAGLVSDRHNFIDKKVNTFIYNGIVLRGDRILDFDYLYDVAYKFIKDEVLGKGYNKLKVYVTGLQPTLASVIKASYDTGITLILLHYNSTTKRYVEQFITGEYDNEGNNLSLLQLYAATRKYCDIKLIDHDTDYYNKLNKLFIIKTDDQNNVENPVIYITDDINKMFKKYSDEVQRIMQRKPIPFRVICEELTFGTTNTEFEFSNTFATYYNAPKNNTYNN